MANKPVTRTRETRVVFDRTRFPEGDYQETYLDNYGGVAIRGLAATGSTMLGYRYAPRGRTIATGSRRWVRAYPDYGEITQYAYVREQEAVELSTSNTSTENIDTEQLTTEAGLLSLDIYGTQGEALMGGAVLGDTRLRIEIDGVPVLVSSQSEITEQQIQEQVPLPPDPDVPEPEPDPETGEIPEPEQQYQTVTRTITVDRQTGVELVQADWLGTGLYTCAQDLQLHDGMSLVITRGADFHPGDLSVTSLVLLDKSASRIYRVTCAPYLEPDAQSRTGFWRSPRIELPERVTDISLGTDVMQIYAEQGGLPLWNTALTAGHIKVQAVITDTRGAVTASSTDLKGVLSANGGRYLRFTVHMTYSRYVSLRQVRLFVNAALAENDYSLSPVIQAGTPTQVLWKDRAYDLRARPSHRKMPKHPLMRSGEVFTCDTGTELVQGRWLSAGYVLTPEKTRAVYFKNNTFMEAAERIPDNPSTEWDRVRSGTWGVTERQLETTSLYTPQLQVTIDGGGEITHEITSLNEKSITLVGYSRSIESQLVSAGAGIQVTVDGNPLMYGKVTGVKREGYPEGRKLTVFWSDALDYHNIDMEQVSEQYSLGQGNSEAAPVPDDELQYMSRIAQSAGLDGVGVTGTVSARDTSYWLAAPNEGGYGGIAEDQQNAYNGQGGTLTQELELVANANLGTVLSSGMSTTQVLVADLMPKWHSRAHELADYSYNLSWQEYGGNTYPVYAPDARLTLSATGYDQSNGYAVIHLEGQSNEFTSEIVTQFVTNINQANGSPTPQEEFRWIFDGGWKVFGLFNKGASTKTLEYRMFAGAGGMKKYYPLPDNATKYKDADELERLLPGWKKKARPGGNPNRDTAEPFTESPYGMWSIPVGLFHDASENSPTEIIPSVSPVYTPEDGGPFRIISEKLLPGKHTRMRIVLTELLVESPSCLMGSLLDGGVDNRMDLSGSVPMITGMRITVHNPTESNNTVEFIVRIPLKGHTADGMRVVPYTSQPNSTYAPRWYESFVAESQQVFQSRMNKKNTVQNPFVVEILPGRFSESWNYCGVPEQIDANPDTGKTRPVYQAGAHVATGMNLWEWLRTRECTVEYAGAPTWKAGQFIEITRRKPDGTAGETDVYMVLEPARLNITVGSDFRTTASIGYIGTVRGENGNPMNAGLFQEEDTQHQQG